VATKTRTFVDTDVLIDIARKNLRALDFWRRAEARSTMIAHIEDRNRPVTRVGDSGTVEKMK
jgi:hypothetical protein